MIKHERVLVTGGAGFLGSYICKRMVDRATMSSAWTTFSPARNTISSTCSRSRTSSSSATTLVTRSFCYCDDLVDVIIAMMNNDNTADPKFVGPLNIGNPGEFTIKQLADQIIELTGSTSKLTFMPLPNDDPLQRKPDIRLAKEKLGWEPKVALREGLTRTIDYFRGVDLDSFRIPTDHKSSEKAAK